MYHILSDLGFGERVMWRIPIMAAKPTPRVRIDGTINLPIFATENSLFINSFYHISITRGITFYW